ncbi:MAG: ABC transporter ATP-binding protein/permease [Trichodesmium sp. St16_bin4-tuft]|nr:ABC transporter ATP-binding protein/permease [Trichodesmium sp. St5_bin8]MDE5092073.1 ABC transporter ATP-binding protein/permease [Trichodesmium sp. St18_bin3_1_1]MDE5100877.1 ABC transporter ATP-binding protein/permease [Trichodesmium sp. St16_bin4-tuft]MDE5102617.1 ABC transporter ATP-binding protein/permease [Trichodesmium sp. St19_bin2]
MAKLYWFSKNEKWRARGLLLLVIVLLGTFTVFNLFLTNQRAEFISALSSQNSERFWRSIIQFFGAVVIAVPFVSSYSFVRQKLSVFWRRWMTESFMESYLSDRSFYKISYHPEIDNPDQRIAQDIKSFTDQSLSFLVITLNAIFQLFGFSTLLWSISKPLVFFVIAYAIAGTVITTGVFGKVLVEINFEQLKREANFRFGLIRVRENAESIAFYRGEKQELQQAKNIFNDVFNNFNRLIQWQLYLDIFRNSYEFITFALPSIIIGPRVLSGELEIGVITQAGVAFSIILSSLTVIVSQLDRLTEFAAGINRLSTFSETVKSSAEVPKGELAIDTITNSYLALEHLTLKTPNYQRTLFRDISLEIKPGDGLLIMGPSGCGKSSILRAIAGLWNSGTGAIYRPKLNEILFLPQKPYMVLGSLRQQLLYPQSNLNISDVKIQEVLEKVNLTKLAERFGGLDAEENWSQVLSVGEQQRVAFTRLLLTQPKYVILDEATSALDVPTEEILYKQLQETSITFISVGHRPTLKKYHQQLLEITANESWQLKPIITLDKR